MKFMMFALAVFVTGIMTGSCHKYDDFTYASRPPIDSTVDILDSIANLPVTDTAEKTWLALGDSYTIGAIVNPDQRFPAQTTALLRGYGFNMKDPEYIATSGWTTLNLQFAIADRNPTGPYDIVSLLIGVNDQYQTSGDTTGYRQRFTALLQKAIQLAGNDVSHVFVLSIPDYSVTPFAATSDTAAIRQELEWFNAINRQVAVSLKADYTDITPSTREAKTDYSLIAGDGLHPSGKEYAKWANMLAPKIKAVLMK